MEREKGRERPVYEDDNIKIEWDPRLGSRIGGYQIYFKRSLEEWSDRGGHPIPEGGLDSLANATRVEFFQIMSVISSTALHESKTFGLDHKDLQIALLKTYVEEGERREAGIK